MSLSLVSADAFNGLNSEAQQQTIRVLLINERKDEYIRVRHILSVIRPHRYELTWCGDRELALEAMLSDIHDVILLDYYARASGSEVVDLEGGIREGARLLTTASQQGCRAPIIVVTDTLDFELDRQVIKAGAADYLVKSQFNARTLERSIRYALDRKETELALSKLAHYDALSGVPNRVLFKDRLERAIQRAERGHQGVALLFLDFDGFKNVNDTYGHDAGDRLIEVIAERLTACMRKTDSVARLGGDEFTVVLEDVKSTADIINVAKKIIQTVARPFPILGHQIVVGCSIGIAPYPEAGTDFDTMLKHADTAMYQAKEVQGSAYKFYSAQIDGEELDQNKIEDELKRASRDSEWLLYFQPRVDLTTRKIVGFECLLRWQHPSRGLLRPSEFLSVAEETGQILQIGYWVIHEACHVLRKLNDLGYPALSISVNLSILQLQDIAFASTVTQILEQSGINPHHLQFEVNEEALMGNADRYTDSMQSVSKLGPSFILDDFGSGSSSFSQLQRLPISAVKIHQSLVTDIERDENDAQVISAMIQLAKSLELQVIADGAEAIEQVRFLKAEGCHSMQGHYFSEAVPYDALCQLLNAKVLLAV